MEKKKPLPHKRSRPAEVMASDWGAAGLSAINQRSCVSASSVDAGKCLTPPQSAVSAAVPSRWNLFNPLKKKKKKERKEKKKEAAADLVSVVKEICRGGSR